MSYFQRVSRISWVLAGMAVSVVAFVMAAPAAFAIRQPPNPVGDAPTAAPPPPVPVHVVAGGGMPGWQITLIAIGAALVASAATVLLGRARLARRHAPATSS